MKKLKIRIALTASRFAVSGNYMLRGAKRSKIEVVVPEGEEEVGKCMGITKDWACRYN